VIWAARAMLARGLVASTLGNVSARSDCGLLITPTRRHPDDLSPTDLVEIGLETGAIERSNGVPSLEWLLHAAIYRARSDVGAVVHTHSPYATARSFEPESLVIRTEERTYLNLDRIEVAAPARPGSAELAHAVAQALGPRPAVLLARHGVIGVGATPRDALEMCCVVEHQALIAALLTGIRDRGTLSAGRDELVDVFHRITETR
jgi:ribulose-5-phosphate 4-epimerase/fuculose-1-phosphate aldolase